MKKGRILVDFLRQSWPLYAVAVLLHVASSIIQVFFPQVLGRFTDALQNNGLSSGLIQEYSLLLLAIGASYVVLACVAQFLIMYIGRRFERLTRSKLFMHFTGLSERFYSKNGVGKLLSYVVNDVTGVRESISMGVNQTASAVTLFFAVVTMMLYSGIPLFLLASSIVPLLLIPFIVTRFGPVIMQRSKKVQASLATMTESAEEQFGGIRVTKKFAVESVMNERFFTTVEQIKDNQLRLVRVSSIFQAIIPFLGALSLIIAISLGGYLTVNGELSLGHFVALTLYIRMLMNPLQQIGTVINTMQRSRASLERLNELLSETPDIQESKAAASLDFQGKSIHIAGLSFTYPGARGAALRDIRLDIRPGMTIGIVGATGSGKTTLMKLLLRTYEAPKGTILFDETDIRDITLESLRSQIGYVPQDGFLFSTSIRDNIAFSDRGRELNAVEESARQAQIFESIMAFPEQFETKLGERGVTLSGGQRQRTSLARGFIKQAPLMILDDSVSAVDAVTETAIMNTVRSMRKGKTTIIVAHRISAIKHADQIIVMKEGTIAQQGTHAELSAKPGLYASLCAIQEEGEADG
ncbi:ATP-binding cassette, subfamily B [Paenibacillus algorifonticola]|uniref:ATP-binding cassette, subfamily B n=1 Tax=Paenibacillus algorifonticola TaxID=684063 RepID=A0A1I2DYK6_9BACL|nr:ABC transporter ATP-binding protein [Paenibacillus algorifonticola]SFE85351.1 ATP-binding cassette, subfamily B [Paenibacillus algorifonticola]